MEDLLKTIKFNCDVSDATYWGYFSVCGLLMRMRDLYRSEHGLKPWQPIPKESIMRWISEKETVWKRLEGIPLKPLKLNDQILGPFDVFSINQMLTANKYVYGAGYSLYMKPSFFIAELESQMELKDYTIYITKRELARDLLSSSAMLQGRCIFIRLEPLKALLWEKLSNLKTAAALDIEEIFQKHGLSITHYPDEEFEYRLEKFALRYSEMLLYHEIAEAVEDIPEWSELLTSLKDKRLEHLLRALKDVLADTSDYGPLKRTIEIQDLDMLKLYLGFIEGYRLVVAPDLTKLSEMGNLELINEKRFDLYQKLRMLRDNILCLFKEKRVDMIKEILETKKLGPQKI